MKAVKALMASPSLNTTFPMAASEAAQSLPMPKLAPRNGASGLAVMSLNLSDIIRPIYDLIMSIMKAMSVLPISFGIGSLFQRTSMLEEVASGSVMIAITGSAF